jgi:CBS-domain-containing membrane protein
MHTKLRSLLLPCIPGLGGFLAILICCLFSQLSQLVLLMAPFGATCVIAFAIPLSPLAQPRSIVGGHMLSTLIGLTSLSLFGAHSWSMALAVGAAITCMQLTRTLHPPAGADPLVVMMAGSSWSFLVIPVLIGSLILVAIAYVYHRSTRTAYPSSWW